METHYEFLKEQFRKNGMTKLGKYFEELMQKKEEKKQMDEEKQKEGLLMNQFYEIGKDIGGQQDNVELEVEDSDDQVVDRITEISNQNSELVTVVAPRHIQYIE